MIPTLPPHVGITFSLQSFDVSCLRQKERSQQTPHLLPGHNSFHGVTSIIHQLNSLKACCEQDELSTVDF